MCCPLFATADWLPDWQVDARNTLTAEYYDVSGDASASPWPYTGSQFYDELELHAHRRVSPWETLRVDVSALANDSEYRFEDNGGVLERASLFWEKGDAGVPFRLSAGDFYAAQSPRTIQLGLKGVQVELQPAGTQSLQFFSGLAAPVYRDLDADAGVFAGVSWLSENATLGGLNLTALHYDRSANDAQAQLNQNVVSAAWYRPWQLGGHQIELETELGHFSGDYDGAAGRQNGDGQSLMLQMAGRRAALGYRLRFERNDEHYRPAGGALTPDHRAIEGHVDWLSAGGRQWRGRAQFFRDDLESANPVDTDLLGISFSGPLTSQSATYLSLDGFVQSRDDSTGTVDADTRHLSLDLVHPVSGTATGRAGLGWTATDDEVTGRDSVDRDLRLALDLGFVVKGWRGTVSPGLALRHNSGAAATDEVSPTLAVNAANGPHTARLSYNWLNQDGRTAGSTDADLQLAGFAYGFRQGAHELGIEAQYFGRDPDNAADTDAYRLSAFWRIALEKPARAPVSRQTPALLPRGEGRIRIGDLDPGMALADIEARFVAERLQPALRREDVVVYEAPLLDTLALRQRVALVHTAGRLDSATLLIAFTDTSNPSGMALDYARTRDLLLQRYGPPRVAQETGVFQSNLNAEMVMGRFERRLEWRSGDRRIRFGVPHRLDGQLRMELVNADSLPAGGEWGLDAVR